MMQHFLQVVMLNMLFIIISIQAIIILGIYKKVICQRRDQPSIFKDKSVISYIPSYINKESSPIICYKYNKLSLVS